jgi:hypothetical protein
LLNGAWLARFCFQNPLLAFCCSIVPSRNIAPRCSCLIGRFRFWGNGFWVLLVSCLFLYKKINSGLNCSPVLLVTLLIGQFDTILKRCTITSVALTVHAQFSLVIQLLRVSAIFSWLQFGAVWASYLLVVSSGQFKTCRWLLVRTNS